MSVDQLEKNWKGFLAGMALMANPGVGHAQATSGDTNKPSKVDLSTVHPELVPISHLESSGGLNVNHAAHSGGEFHTAVGHLGFKPVTAYDTYHKSRHLQTLFPDLQDQMKFLDEMKKNPNFYNSLAAAHWTSLKTALGSPSKAAYAWRHGRGSAFKATPEQVDSDPYVKKYNEILGRMGKSEDLMLKGEKIEHPRKVIEKLSGARSGRVYNYDHLLTPMQVAEGYSVRLNDLNNKWAVSLNHNGMPVGGVNANHNGEHPLLQDKLTVGDAFIHGPDAMSGHPGHRGRGLGQALYEALYSHAKHKGNIKHAIGGVYSAMASDVHKRLAEKHGINFVSHPVQNLNPTLYDVNKGSKYVIPTEQDDKYVLHHNRYPEQYLKSEKFNKKLTLTEKIHLRLSEESESTEKTETGDYTGWLNSVVDSYFA